MIGRKRHLLQVHRYEVGRPHNYTLRSVLQKCQVSTLLEDTSCNLHKYHIIYVNSYWFSEITYLLYKQIWKASIALGRKIGGQGCPDINPSKLQTASRGTIEAEIRIDDELTNKTTSDVGWEIRHTVKSNFTIIGKTASQMQLCINRTTFGMTK